MSATKVDRALLFAGDEPSWRRRVFSTDHRVIGLQFGITALLFLAFGFFLIMVMRWSIAHPDRPIPVVGDWIFFRHWTGEDGLVKQAFYHMFGAMHGTVMVFLGVVPLAFTAFGNYVVPLQIGASNMAFPRLNMISYWLFLAGGVLMLSSFLGTGQSLWLLAMVFVIGGLLLGAVNTVITIINLRARGMTWLRMPLFCWTQLATGFLLLLAFPVLEVAVVMQLIDRLTGSSFFVPGGSHTGGEWLHAAGGASPLLYQHLFWFLGHPEVYVLILPGIGIVAEIIPNNTRRPLSGYQTMVGAIVALAFLSFVVWTHHMYVTAKAAPVSSFQQIVTMLLSVPLAVLIWSLFKSMWGKPFRFTIPMLWAAAYIPMFAIGCLTGLPLAFNLLDLRLQDTYYVIGHFHYIVAPGTMFALFAGIYYWFPRHTGRQMNRVMGHLHFWSTLICMNLIFLPMFLQGLAGMQRRAFDGGRAYEQISQQVYLEAGHPVARTFNTMFRGGEKLPLEVVDFNLVTSAGALLLALAQIPFVINFFLSIFAGRKLESSNPWLATTLEWAAASRPVPGGMDNPEPIVVRRSPYEYGVAGTRDFICQAEPEVGVARNA